MPACGMRLTVLIVHDHAPFRTSASALLESEGFDVIGEAADGKAAISESELLRPVELDARAREYQVRASHASRTLRFPVEEPPGRTPGGYKTCPARRAPASPRGGKARFRTLPPRCASLKSSQVAPSAPQSFATAEVSPLL
jgi:hypothetical protein